MNRLMLEILIDLACNADDRKLSNGSKAAAQLTINQALEVLGAKK